MTFQRREPLRRGKSLARKPMKQARKPIKARSGKAQARDDARRELVIQWLAAAAEASPLGIPECEMQFCRECAGVAVTAHEPLLRSRGGDPTNRAQVLLTCNACHTGPHGVHLAVGAERERAYALGFLVHTWEA